MKKVLTFTLALGLMFVASPFASSTQAAEQEVQQARSTSYEIVRLGTIRVGSGFSVSTGGGEVIGYAATFKQSSPGSSSFTFIGEGFAGSGERQIGEVAVKDRYNNVKVFQIYATVVR